MTEQTDVDAMYEPTVAAIRAADIAAGGQQCRVCHCTDNAGCWPPCWWIEPTLCSSCKGKETR